MSAIRLGVLLAVCMVLPAAASDAVQAPEVTRLTLEGDILTVASRGVVPLEARMIEDGAALLLPFATLADDHRAVGALSVRAGPPGITVYLADRVPQRIATRETTTGELVLTFAALPEGGMVSPLPPRRPRAAGDAVFLVALDPGHGGADPGAIADGLTEKTLTLTMARRIQRRIEDRPGMAAMLTRGGDRFLPLGERVRRAVAAGANAFISIHADIVIEGDASGLAVYTLTPEARADAAADATAFEPRDRLLRGQDLAGQGDDVTRVLVDLAQRRATGRGGQLAEALLEGLDPVTPLLRTRPRRTGDFRVLRGADLPAVLVELGFLSSAEDRERLADRRWQARVAEAMAAAIDRWRLDDAMNGGQTAR